MQISHLQKFLQRARRTWTVWTVAEHAGLGLLCGCCCVLLLLPILLWRGQPGQTLAIVFPLLGSAIGTILGLRARPNLETVAQLADRRFQTSDLLATAYALRESADPWHASILNLADKCALGLSPASLTPHRLGPRAWSGIFLSLVAAITLGLLSVTMPADRAQAVIAPTVADASAAWVQPREAPSIGQQSNPAREAKAESTPDSQPMGSSNDVSAAGALPQRSDPANRDGQGDMGAGGGSARTDSPQFAMPANHAALAGRDSIADAAVATAGQGSEVRSHGSGGAMAGRVAGGHGPDVAPWSALDWPAAQAGAFQAIQAGQIPDAYRNLVRDYFDRSDRDAHQ